MVVASECEACLEKRPVDARLARPPLVPVFRLNRRETSDVIPDADYRACQTRHPGEDNVALGNMDVLPAIVRFPQLGLPWEPIGELGVVSQAVRIAGLSDLTVIHV